MARNARRSTRGRKVRRGNRTLSTRRIFNNKGAKAQAAQIYALRKSVNRVRRQCAPEVKVQYTTTANRIFSVSGSVPITDAIVPMPNIVEGVSDTARVGNMIKLYPLKINTSMFYEEVINSRLGYPPFSELRSHGAQIRFFALQSRSALNSPPTLADVLRDVNFTTDIDSSMMMRMPFKTGITARFNILKNTVFTMSKDKPCLSTVIKVAPKSRTLRHEQGYSYPKGFIWVFWLASGMVKRTSQEGEATVEDYNNISVSWRMEQAFTDA